MEIRRKLPIVLVALLALASSAVSEEKPWREVRSPHFRVITNGSEGSARHVAREFEQVRSLFADQFPGFTVDSPVPLVILAPQDEATTKKLAPGFWLHSGPKPAGIYFHGWEKQYALVRLDAVNSDRIDPDTFAVVYHEYVHSLLHLNFRWLPTWLDEGLAQFYGFTRFEGSKTYIGAPPRNAHRLDALYNRALPLEKLLEQRGAFTRSEEDTHLFYAQSWALTHFLTLGPGMENGARLKRFFNALQAGTEQKKAFQDSFGDFSALQKNLDNYVHLFAFPTGVIPTPPQADEKNFEARTLSVAETLAELGMFLRCTHYWKEARTSIEEAVKIDPKLALAHENLGFLDLREGKDEEGIHELSQALELDGHLYRALFIKTMLSPLPHATSTGDRELYRAALMKVLDDNSKFAPAFVALAKLAVAEGNLTRALALARTAEKIEPSRAGYHLLTGQILLRVGQPADAAVHAAFVANRWGIPDHDEAMELWNLVPQPQRPAEAPLEPQAVEATTVEGTVRSVACSDDAITLTLDRDGKSFVFNLKGKPGGFADTLWTGHDLFDPCIHMTGLRAVVRYKASADRSSTGDVVNWGFRDDLPPAPKISTEATQHN